MDQLWIQNVTVLDEANHFQKKDIWIQNHIIHKIIPSKQESIPFSSQEIIDGNDFLLLPGLMNCHTHIPMVLFRGLAEDLPLQDWLHQKIFPLESKLTPELVYYGALVGIAELIRSGCTFFADMYFFMDEVAKAVSLSGIRANLSIGLISQNGDQGLRQTEEFFNRYHQSAQDRIQVFLGPHAPYTCDLPYLKKTSDLAKSLQTGIHIHLNETRSEVMAFENQFHKKPIQALHDIGFFETPMICAHCVHMSEEEMDILKQSNVLVAHNPVSNLKLASGIAPITNMAKQGVNLSLGTDGAASNNQLNLFQEMHLASLLAKSREQDSSVMPADYAFDMATRIPGEYLYAGQCGQIKEGCLADLIMIDLTSTNLFPSSHLNKSFIHSMQGNEINTVIINGRLVMKDRKILTFDEIESKKKANELVRKYLA